MTKADRTELLLAFALARESDEQATILKDAVRTDPEMAAELELLAPIRVALADDEFEKELRALVQSQEIPVGRGLRQNILLSLFRPRIVFPLVVAAALAITIGSLPRPENIVVGRIIEHASLVIHPGTAASLGRALIEPCSPGAQTGELGANTPSSVLIGSQDVILGFRYWAYEPDGAASGCTGEPTATILIESYDPSGGSKGRILSGSLDSGASYTIAYPISSNLYRLATATGDKRRKEAEELSIKVSKILAADIGESERAFLIGMRTLLLDSLSASRR